jgi:hypothetical protein
MYPHLRAGQRPNIHPAMARITSRNHRERNEGILGKSKTNRRSHQWRSTRRSHDRSKHRHGRCRQDNREDPRIVTQCFHDMNLWRERKRTAPRAGAALARLLRREIVERVLRRQPITVAVADPFEGDHPILIQNKGRWIRRLMGHIPA